MMILKMLAVFVTMWTTLIFAVLAGLFASYGDYPLTFIYLIGFIGSGVLAGIGIAMLSKEVKAFNKARGN
jgi:hypothetical protein